MLTYCGAYGYLDITATGACITFLTLRSGDIGLATTLRYAQNGRWNITGSETFNTMRN